MTTVEELVASKEIIVVCGPGGVGKTSIAACIGAMAATHQGGRTLVLTVDPARRLVDALGMKASPSGGPRAQQVRASAFAAAGAAPRGELWVEMLDAKVGWDNLILRHAPDPSTAQRLFANPIYQDISGRFVQSHDYIAVERLCELHAEGDYDLIVVDTPPTRNAVDFLTAPQRMVEFFSSRLLRILTVPYRGRFADLAARPFFYVADRVLGTQFLEDITQFFMLTQALSAGFVERAGQVERLLSDRRSSFLVVSTLETVPVREAEAFIRMLPTKRLHLGGIVLNRVLPSYLTEGAPAQRAEALAAEAPELAKVLSSPGGPLEAYDAPLVERVLVEIATNFNNVSIVARREAAQRTELSRAYEIVACVPELDDDVHDLAGALELGRHVWSARTA